MLRERHRRCQLDLVSVDRRDVVWEQVFKDQQQVLVDRVLQVSAHQAFLLRASHLEDHQAFQVEEADHVSFISPISMNILLT